MTREDALELARRVKRSWRTHQSLDEWCGFLVGFDDPAIAGRALDQLREVEPLAFRDFGAKYRALAASAPAPVESEPAGRLVRDLTREQRMAILAAAGAPRHMTTRQQGAHPL